MILNCEQVLNGFSLLTSPGQDVADFIIGVRPVDIKIDLDDLDAVKGFKVLVTDDPDSSIQLVEEVVPNVFQQQMLSNLQMISIMSD